MRIFFLGTAASEGYPGIFCQCASCQQARKLGGPNLRFRSAVLVNEDLLIDFGPDLQASALRFNLSLWKVKTGLVTHAHSDHFYSGNFGMRGDAFTGKLPPPRLRLYGPTEVGETLHNLYADLSDLHLEANTVHAGDSWEEGDYTFNAFRAYHAVGRLEALFYSVEDEKKSFLYVTDTGLFPEETKQALMGRSFDLIVMEETMGDGDYDQHLGFDSFLQQVGWMRGQNMLRAGGRIIAHHFSHSNNPLHEALKTILNPHGIEVAYDGLVIEI